MAKIEAICISRRKGTAKTQVPRAELRENWGIIGDAHAGGWHRQVSLLAAESIEKMKARIPGLSPGAFAENMVTSGLDLARLRVGDRLRLGHGVVLEVTQIGKVCHKACAIRALTGDCIMPREGIFTRVVRGGEVLVGDRVEPVNQGGKILATLPVSGGRAEG